MENDRSIKIIALVALIMSVVGLTVAYASFSASLKISGTVTAKASGSSWDVHFAASDGNTTTLTPSLIGSAAIGTAATLSATQISGFNINFFAPGDTVEYDFKVVNDGILDATLTSFSLGSISCAPAAGSNATQEEATELCRDLTMSLTYDDDTDSAISIEATTKSLAKSTSRDLKLFVQWKPDSTLQISGDILVTVGESTFVYTQA